MTCIAAVVDGDGIVWMGADSSVVRGSYRRTMRGGKLRRFGDDLVIGYAGSLRQGQVVLQELQPTRHPASYSDERYLSAFLVRDLMAALRAAGATAADGGSGGQMSSNFLIGYHGSIYLVDGAGAVVAYPEDYACIGSGSEVAHGALHATAGVLPAKDRVLRALAAAAAHCIDVSGPFDLQELPPLGCIYLTEASEIDGTPYAAGTPLRVDLARARALVAGGRATWADVGQVAVRLG